MKEIMIFMSNGFVTKKSYCSRCTNEFKDGELVFEKEQGEACPPV